jgi:hypothetical protein
MLVLARKIWGREALNNDSLAPKVPESVKAFLVNYGSRAFSISSELEVSVISSARHPAADIRNIPKLLTQNTGKTTS